MAGGRSSCYIILVNALLICLQAGKLNGNNSVLLNFVFAYVYSLSIDTQLIMQMLPYNYMSSLNWTQNRFLVKKTGNGQLTDIRWRNSNLLPDIRYGQKYIQRHPRNANTCKSFRVNFGFHELLIRAGGQKKAEVETREDKSDVTAFAELVTSFVDCSLFWCVSVVLCFLFFVLVH